MAGDDGLPCPDEVCNNVPAGEDELDGCGVPLMRAPASGAPHVTTNEFFLRLGVITTSLYDFHR
jgi:hypothetical protein